MIFERHSTKAMAAFIAKEGPTGTGRVIGLSIEPDGVFIYTESAEWCDDSGAGSFRADSETAAIRKFYERVTRGDGNTEYPQPEFFTHRRANAANTPAPAPTPAQKAPAMRYTHAHPGRCPVTYAADTLARFHGDRADALAAVAAYTGLEGPYRAAVVRHIRSMSGPNPSKYQLKAMRKTMPRQIIESTEARRTGFELLASAAHYRMKAAVYRFRARDAAPMLRLERLTDATAAMRDCHATLKAARANLAISRQAGHYLPTPSLWEPEPAPVAPAPIKLRKQVETIDLTPTWESLLPVLVEVAANGTSHTGRTAAMGELMRLARIVDAQNAAAKA